MKIFKKIFLFFTVFVLAVLSVGVVGCSGNPGGRGDQTTLKIWIQSTNQPSYFMGWFKQAFESENPGIELQFTPSTSLDGSLDVSLTGKDAPDISATWAHILPTLASGNRIQNLDTVISPYEDDFQDMALMNKVNGSHYGAPIFGFSSPVIYFNRDVLEGLGLIPANWQGPANYAELKTLCQEIGKQERPSSNGQKYKALVVSSGFHMMNAVHARTMTPEQLEAIIEPYSATAANPFDASGFENGFNSVKQMATDKVFDTTLFGSSADALDTFRTGEALMVSAESLDLLALSSCSFEIGSFVLPADIPYSSTATDGTAQSGAGTPESLVSGIYTDVFVVNQKTDKTEECKKFFDFLYSDAAQEKLLEFFLFPVKKNTSLNGMSAGKKELFNAVLKNTYDVAQTDGMTPFYTTYFHKDGLDVIVDDGYKAMIRGNSIDSTISAAKAKWTA